MSTQLIVGLLGGGGLGAIAAAIIAGLFSKRKIGAEATDIITKAAAGVVTSVQTELDRQVRAREDAALQYRLDIAALVESYDLEREEVRKVLQLHVAWDVLVVAAAAKHGIDLPEAPPLLPPLRPSRPEV